MDPLSFTASLIAVMQVAQNLAGVTYKYGKSVSNSSAEFKNLVDEIMALNGVIVGLKSIIEPGSGNEPTLYRTLTSLRGPMQDCEVQLSSLHKVLVTHQRAGTRLMRIRKRLTWPMKASETVAWIEKVEKYKSLFTLALTADQTVVNHQISKDVHEMKATQGEMKVIQEKQREEALNAKNVKEFKKIIAWLSPVRPRENHSINQQLQQAGTGLWFTKGNDYDQWRTAENSFLWVHGMPGAGKTVLSSIIIDDLIEQQSYTGVKLLFFYCDFRDKSKQRLDYIYGSLLAQLLGDRGYLGLSDELRAHYDELNGARASAKVLYDLFKTLILASPRVAIVIDALDECEDAKELLTGLLEVYNTPGSNINILVTSRDEIDIRLKLKHVSKVPIVSNVISKDIQLFVTDEIERRPRLERLGQNMKDEVVTALTQNSNGMFRWASCVLDLIEKHQTNRAIRNSLSSLPPDLEETYDRILENISVVDENRKLAQRVFNWLVLSCRPMMLDEVVEAIAVDIGASLLDEDSLLSRPEGLTEICGNLVVIDFKTETVSLAHFSVKEYFLSKKRKSGLASEFLIVPETNHDLARVCLTYLMFDDFNSGPCNTAPELNKRLNDYPFLAYAALYWGLHARQHRALDDEPFLSMIRRFFLPDSPVAAAFVSWTQVHDALKIAGRGPLQRNEYLLYNRAHGDDRKLTRLLYACSLGLLSSVQHLLSLGFDPTAIHMVNGKITREWYGTPLHAACASKNIELVKLLIDRGSPVNAVAGPYGTALSRVCSMRDASLTKCLIDSGADINESCPLNKAIRSNSLDCVDLLIKAGVDLRAKEPYKDKPYIEEACWKAANLTILKRLVEVGAAKIDALRTAPDATKWVAAKTSAFALPAAAATSCSDIVEAIMRREGQEIMKHPDSLVLLLHGAQSALVMNHLKERIACFQLMMQYGDDEFTDKYGTQFLELISYAFKRLSLIPILNLWKGRKISFGRSVLHAAAAGDMWILSRLIEHGADLTSPDCHGWTAMACALQYQNPKIVELLIECGVDKDVQLETARPTSWKKSWSVIALWFNPNPNLPKGFEFSNGCTAIKLTSDFQGDECQFYSSGNGVFVHADHPVPYDYTDWYYFEVEISGCQNTTVSVGLADSLCEVDDRETTLRLSPKGEHATATYTVVGSGEMQTVGCAVSLRKNLAFFTLNGRFLEGETWEGVRGMLYPIAYLEGSGTHIQANFGNRPFHTKELSLFWEQAERDLKQKYTPGKVYEDCDYFDNPGPENERLEAADASC